ncbi:MAG: hypothetical protein J7494_08275 [Sphingobium sp.]|nr:hypothetical protein [Sphingobium sp.]
MAEKPLPPIHHGDQDSGRLPDEGPPIRTRRSDGDEGRRAPREGSGVVVGSGADAGGTGTPAEDYDTDSVGGGGGDVMSRPRDPKRKNADV